MSAKAGGSNAWKIRPPPEASRIIDFRVPAAFDCSHPGDLVAPLNMFCQCHNRGAAAFRVACCLIVRSRSAVTRSQCGPSAS